MTMLQGAESLKARGWNGLGGRPKNRTWLWITAATLGAAGVLLLWWWVATDAWPSHLIRQDTAAIRSIELPAEFEPAPVACASATVLCAWTDLDPEEAAEQVSDAIAGAGIELPTATCGVGSPVPFLNFAFTSTSSVPGSCYAQVSRRGASLAVHARNQVPISDEEIGPIDMPRTLVTAAWYSARDIPGTPKLEDVEHFVGPAELAALPSPFDLVSCDPGWPECASPQLTRHDDQAEPDTFWVLLDEIIATGAVVDWVDCGTSGCEAQGRLARPDYPGESFVFILKRGWIDASEYLELSLIARP